MVVGYVSIVHVDMVFWGKNWDKNKSRVSVPLERLLYIQKPG
jgi:hypothetical protein